MTQEFSESHIYAHYLNVVRIILMSCSLYYTHTYCGPNRTAFYHCTGDYDGILVGDRGYACRQYFMTPFPDPNPGPQTRYNAALARTRACIEMTFGQLKGIFQCLKSLRVAPDRACDINVACAVLHNIATIRKERTPVVQVQPDDDLQPVHLDQPSGSTRQDCRTPFLRRI